MGLAAFINSKIINQEPLESTGGSRYHNQSSFALFFEDKNYQGLHDVKGLGATYSFNSLQGCCF